MNVFGKILQSQESGYSGNKPNQRGKYIIVPKEAWVHLPELTTGIRNSFCTIRLNLPNGSTISAIYVWNNTKYFPELGLKRDHDERRLYRTKSIEEILELDREVIVFFAQTEDRYEFNAISITPLHKNYQKFKEYLNANNSSIISIEEIESIDSQSATILKNKNSLNNVNNLDELLPDLKKRLSDQKLEREASQNKVPGYLGPIVEITDDPLMVASASFRTQDDFKKQVRATYNNRCAVRGVALVDDDPRTIGLEAAHIHAQANGGNFLPSNGILLSSDLHKAFDSGYWTLNDDLSIKVHEYVKSGSLKEIDGKKINIPLGNEVFAPFLGYIKWNREHRFGLFSRNQQT